MPLTAALLIQSLSTANKKRLRRSRSMPLGQLNLAEEEPARSMYNHPNTHLSKTPSTKQVQSSHASPFVDTEEDITSQLLPPLPMKMLERLEREREIQYNRDVAAYKLENRNPLMLHYRHATPVDYTHSTKPRERPMLKSPSSQAGPVPGELQWDWNFPEYRRSKRSSARYSKNLKSQWHMNASCDNISPLELPKDWEGLKSWDL